MISEKLFFAKKSEMTEFAVNSGLEMIRCKQPCEHVPVGRPAILLVNGANVIEKRLIRCKVCNNKQGGAL